MNMMCKDSAYKKFIQYLGNKGEKIINITDTNYNRHRMIKTDKSKYYLIYKRDFYNSFGKYFESFVRGNDFYKGKGESVNEEQLDFCLFNQVKDIVFLHNFKHDDEEQTPCNCFYFYTPMAIKKIGLKRLQKKKNTYRSFGSYENKNEMTYSIPIEICTRVILND